MRQTRKVRNPDLYICTIPIIRNTTMGKKNTEYVAEGMHILVNQMQPIHPI